MPNEAQHDGQKEQSTSTAQSQTTTTDSKDVEFEPITSQEQLNKIIGERVNRERKKFSDYDELRDKASRFDELEEAQKTELQKAVERAEKAEAEKLEIQTQFLRTKIASTHDVPADLLVGTSEEELEASAKKLVEFREKENEKKASRGGSHPWLGLPPADTDKGDTAAVASALFDT